MYGRVHLPGGCSSRFGREDKRGRVVTAMGVKRAFSGYVGSAEGKREKQALGISRTIQISSAITRRSRLGRSRRSFVVPSTSFLCPALHLFCRKRMNVYFIRRFLRFSNASIVADKECTVIGK